MKRLLVTLLAGSMLSGCVSTSTRFGPPDVNLRQEMTNVSLSRDCLPTGTLGAGISHDVKGALKLIDNFIAGYRCTMRVAADGRQGFEIPAFLSLIGSTAAVALGAGPDVAIAGGMGNSFFNAAGKYYDPKEQTEILVDAVDALTCIQSEAVGISAFDLATTAKQEKGVLFAMNAGTVDVTVEQQYFNMVSSALLSVERAATRRLSRRGSFDPAGVAAEIDALTKKIEAAEAARKNPPPPPPPPSNPGMDKVKFAELQTAYAAAVRNAQLTQLNLDLLQPKLQKCVVRAKS